MPAVTRLSFPAVRAALCAMLCVALGACTALPDRPQRPALYDFGVGRPLAAAASASSVLVLAEVEAAGVTEGAAAVQYRLAYAGDQQLRPYALARWSLPPTQLVRQRLRERLGQDHVVLGAAEAQAVLAQEASPRLLLRLDLEEFSQVFDKPEHSVGLLRLRATLFETLPSGDRLRAQRVFVAQPEAATADAAGGVAALATATDRVADELAQWVQANGAR